MNVTCLKGKELQTDDKIFECEDEINIKILGTDKYIELYRMPRIYDDGRIYYTQIRSLHIYRI